MTIPDQLYNDECNYGFERFRVSLTPETNLLRISASGEVVWRKQGDYTNVSYRNGHFWSGTTSWAGDGQTDLTKFRLYKLDPENGETLMSMTAEELDFLVENYSDYTADPEDFNSARTVKLDGPVSVMARSDGGVNVLHMDEGISGEVPWKYRHYDETGSVVWSSDHSTEVGQPIPRIFPDDATDDFYTLGIPYEKHIEKIDGDTGDVLWTTGPIIGFSGIVFPNELGTPVDLYVDSNVSSYPRLFYHQSDFEPARSILIDPSTGARVEDNKATAVFGDAMCGIHLINGSGTECVVSAVERSPGHGADTDWYIYCQDIADPSGYLWYKDTGSPVRILKDSENNIILLHKTYGQESSYPYDFKRFAYLWKMDTFGNTVWELDISSFQEDMNYIYENIDITAIESPTDACLGDSDEIYVCGSYL